MVGSNVLLSITNTGHNTTMARLFRPLSDSRSADTILTALANENKHKFRSNTRTTKLYTDTEREREKQTSQPQLNEGEEEHYGKDPKVHNYREMVRIEKGIV